MEFLKNDRRYGGNTVMLGVPTFWRTLQRDAVRDPLLHKVILKADVISPWTIGRYRTPDQARAHGRRCTEPDIKWSAARGKDYLPESELSRSLRMEILYFRVGSTSSAGRGRDGMKRSPTRGLDRP